MAQDPEGNETARPEGNLDASADFDMVTLFSSSGIDAELEANNIHAILSAAGIPSLVVGSSVIPSLEYQVQTPRASAEDALRTLREAEAAGPEGAAEAEAASEEGR